MPWGSEPLDAPDADAVDCGVCVPGVVDEDGGFCCWSVIVDCEEVREKVLEKGAPRWVSFNSTARQH